MTKILRRDDPSTSATVQANTADDFIKFFAEKVKSVREGTADCRPSTSFRTVKSSMTEFMVCSEDDVRRTIMASPTKSCTLDPIHTFLLKETLDPLLLYVTAMINASLREGCLLTSQKQIITPLLKKPSLDSAEMKNF